MTLILYILVASTIIYLVSIIFILNKKSSTEKSNIGSFISGALTPITIVWLIYGYAIQTEINNSTISLINIQKNQLERKSKPIFEYIDNRENIIHGPSITTTFTVFRFINHGAEIYGLNTYDDGDYIRKVNVWKRGGFEEISIKGELRKEELPVKFDVYFYDENGFKRNYILKVLRNQEHINRTDLKKFPSAIYSIRAELTERTDLNTYGN